MLFSGFSLVAASRGPLSGCAVRVSLYSGFSCCGAQVLGCMAFRNGGAQALSTGSVVVALRLRCSVS